MYSSEHIKYLEKRKINKFVVTFFRSFILFSFLFIWEFSARYNLINTFLTSSPFEIIKTLYNLFLSNNLLSHIWITFYETFISFSISSIIGICFAAVLWNYKTLSKIFDPYLTVLNSLPKVSLGPLLIIFIGANTKSIILMAVLITVFTTIINMYNAFISTDEDKIILFKSFNASRFQIFTKLVFMGNIPSLINTLKINISLSLIGVIMGEILVSKKGLGYLITYGSQVFNLNLVITSIVVLGILSYVIYSFINGFGNKLIRKY